MTDAKECHPKRVWSQNEDDLFLEALTSAETEGSRLRWKFIKEHEVYGPYFKGQGIDKREMMIRYKTLSKGNKNFAQSNFPSSMARIMWTTEDENELLKAVAYARENTNTKHVFKYILKESKFAEYFTERNYTHNQLYSKYKSLKLGIRSHATKITKDRVYKHVAPANPKIGNRRRKWTEEEINLFRAGMLKHGRKWSAIIDDELFCELFTKYGRDNEDLRLKARDDEMRRKNPIILTGQNDANVRRRKLKSGVNIL